MKVNDSLKQDFWIELEKQYPQGVKVFNEFLDEYKKSVNWQDLFRDHLNSDAKFSSPKFYDLPHAMQLGIWLFFLDKTDLNLKYNGLRDNIKQTIKIIETDNMS